MSLLSRPKILYPIIRRGFIQAPVVRLESLEGPEILLPRGEFPDDFIDFGPIQHKDKTYFVSHLQKAAYSFSLLYDPFIFHHWVGQPQKKDRFGNWISGSEKGNLWRLGYWRSPGWRWQQPDANSNWTPWILSGGRIPGEHFD